MDNKYHINYFNSIKKGLLSSRCFINYSEVGMDTFLTRINKLLKLLGRKKSKIFFFGNGASAAFANHMALDFSKNGKILSRSLSDSALLTALSNDYTYEEAMVEFLKIEEIKREDLVITISSSGNSENIVGVLNYCKGNGIKTLALSWLKDDNKSLSIATYSIYVPMKTYGMVECIHQIFLHMFLDYSMGVFEWMRADVQNMDAKNYKI